MADIKRVAWAVRSTGDGGKSSWSRIGVSFENKDGSESVLLDAVPLSGKIVLQDPKKPEPKDETDKAT